MAYVIYIALVKLLKNLIVCISEVVKSFPQVGSGAGIRTLSLLLLSPGSFQADALPFVLNSPLLEPLVMLSFSVMQLQLSREGEGIRAKQLSMKNDNNLT